MTMIFQRDEKGLLHQLDITLEQVASEGRGTNLVISQHMYVIFTDKEQKAFDDQKAAAQKALLDEKLANDKAKEAKFAAAEKDIEQSNKIQKAREAAEAAKDNALALALEAISELKAKVAELSSRS